VPVKKTQLSKNNGSIVVAVRCFPTEKQDCRDGNLASRGGGPLVEVGLPCRQQAGTAGNDP